MPLSLVELFMVLLIPHYLVEVIGVTLILELFIVA